MVNQCSSESRLGSPRERVCPVRTGIVEAAPLWASTSFEDGWPGGHESEGIEGDPFNKEPRLTSVYEVNCVRNTHIVSRLALSGSEIATPHIVHHT